MLIYKIIDVLLKYFLIKSKVKGFLYYNYIYYCQYDLLQNLY